MSKVRNFSEIAPNIAFQEFNFYELYYSTFEKSELGRIKKLLPLREMAENFGLVRKSMRPKLLDDIMMELAGKLKIQQLQGILADKWRPYMENLDTMYTEATCYESEMRYPTDAKLLWEGVEKSYATMCELSSRLGIHSPQTKFLDVQKANLTYRKQRKHSRSQTRKITRRLLDLLGKILKETLATRELKTGTTARRTEYRHLS